MDESGTGRNTAGHGWGLRGIVPGFRDPAPGRSRDHLDHDQDAADHATQRERMIWRKRLVRGQVKGIQPEVFSQPGFRL